jgi:prepilin-type N-terminal cleavage/methylation domain-containing protein
MGAAGTGGVDLKALRSGAEEITGGSSDPQTDRLGAHMLSRLRRSMSEKDQGFTQIELLVVIIIIGILAAIAIPVFLNQRKKGVDASLQSDLKNVALAMETYYADKQAYPPTGDRRPRPALVPPAMTSVSTVRSSR